MELLRRWRERGLLRRVRNGDRDAANQLMDAHYEAVYRWLLHLCRRREEAADLTQETFLQVWEGLDGFQGRASLKTWIHRIAYYTYLRAERSAQPERRLLAEARNDPALAEAVVGRQVVEEALAQLPEGQRQVVVLHYLQSLTSAEIAGVLGVPVGTVLSRLHTARGKLRELLSDEPSPSQQEVHTDVAQE